MVKTVFFSIGHRCSSSGLLQLLGLKTESYPFDWIVSNLAVVRHCIETDFRYFLDASLYQKMDSATVNHLDGRVVDIMQERAEVNGFYFGVKVLEGEKTRGVIPQSFKQIGYVGNYGEKTKNGIVSTYWLPLALTHHSFANTEDIEYFKRCVGRFRELLLSENRYYIKKRYMYVHPFIGVYEYDWNKAVLKQSFKDFAQFMGDCMGDAFGLFIVPVFLDRGAENRTVVWEELFRTERGVFWKVEISYWGFSDSGKTFGGDHEVELKQFEAMIRREFYADLPCPESRADLDAVILHINRDS